MTSAARILATLQPGAVCIHVDGGGNGKNHHCVFLSLTGKPGRELACCVMLTSRHVWGARPATVEELALFGYASSKPTFLIRAIREIDDLHPTGVVLSEQRRRALFLEFFRSEG